MRVGNFRKSSSAVKETPVLSACDRRQTTQVRRTELTKVPMIAGIANPSTASIKAKPLRGNGGRAIPTTLVVL